MLCPCTQNGIMSEKVGKRRLSNTLNYLGVIRLRLNGVGGSWYVSIVATLVLLLL